MSEKTKNIIVTITGVVAAALVCVTYLTLTPDNSSEDEVLFWVGLVVLILFLGVSVAVLMEALTRTSDNTANQSGGASTSETTSESQRFAGLGFGTAKVIKDNATGVRYLFVEGDTGSGLTVLVDQDGKPLIEEGDSDE